MYADGTRDNVLELELLVVKTKQEIQFADDFTWGVRRFVRDYLDRSANEYGFESAHMNDSITEAIINYVSFVVASWRAPALYETSEKLTDMIADMWGRYLDAPIEGFLGDQDLLEEYIDAVCNKVYEQYTALHEDVDWYTDS